MPVRAASSSIATDLAQKLIALPLIDRRRQAEQQIQFFSAEGERHGRLQIGAGQMNSKRVAAARAMTFSFLSRKLKSERRRLPKHELAFTGPAWRRSELAGRQGVRHTCQASRRVSHLRAGVGIAPTKAWRGWPEHPIARQLLRPFLHRRP